MAVITPRLTITAKASGTTPEAAEGPASIALSLTATPKDGTSTVTAVSTQIYVTTTSPVKVLDSAEYSGDQFVYMKSLETVTHADQEIYVGITEGTQNDMETESGTNDRTFIFKAGDFAYYPWSGDQDVYVEGSSAGDKLEIWVFKQ